MELNRKLCLCLFALLAFSYADLPVNQPKANVWVTLANASGLDTICLSTTTPEKPFSTCLVGVPVDAWPIPIEMDEAIQGPFVNTNVWNYYNPVDAWDWWVPHLPEASSEPQELEILGSTYMTFCVKFNYTNKDQSLIMDVTPHHNLYKNQTLWCNYTSLVHSVYDTPFQLPRGVFFICGDRIWPAIPAHITGGPCSVGKLTLLTPSAKLLAFMRHRSKRFIHQYQPDCNDNFVPWGPVKRLSAALLLPQLASGVALKQLDRLGCWLSKEFNATSLALSDMLTDTKDVRHATLQNRAAIDFLLLAHGHGCEDFEGMCCMNLSDHSESIHKSIQQLKEGVSKIRVDSGTWLDNLLDGWNLTAWVKELLKMGFYILVIIIVVLIMVPCLLQCIRQMINNAVKGVYMVQTGGGDDGVKAPLDSGPEESQSTGVELKPLDKLRYMKSYQNEREI